MENEMTQAQRKLARVVLVEDHRVLRDSFRLAFGADRGFEVVGDTGTAAMLDELCTQLCPDLVLMDVCTDGGASGLDALERLRPLYPHMKFILMSGFNELSYSPRARELGASAFIFKSKGVDFFLETARSVLAGAVYFPEEQQIPPATGEAPFTEREMEILRQLCMYKSRHTLAEDLHISEKTLKKHIENMLAKTEFSSMTDLIIYVISNGWINPKF